MKKGLLFRNVIIICCWLLLFFVSSVNASDKKEKSLTENDLKGITKIAIVIEQKRPAFEVLHWRAKTAYGISSLGGFAGDAIAHGIDKDKDSNEAALMNPGDIQCSAIFKESLEPLNNSKKFEKVYITSGENKKELSDYDAVLTFTINRWGLRLVERENEKLSAFVELKAEMVSAKEKKPVWDERQVIVGNKRQTVAEFTADSNMLNSELQDAIKKAGTQMSNALIYPAAAPDEKPKSKKEKVKTGKVTALEINNSIDFKVGTLSSVRPLKIEVETFTDNRQIKDRIGDLRNGFGGKAGIINTARPAPEIAREAISAIFAKNGHIINNGEKDIVISGSVETYWFESQLRMSSWELMGTVDVNMVVKDGNSKVLYSKRYLGHNDKVLGLFWPKTIIEIMDAAMANMTDQIPFDTGLIEAINKSRK